jgi:hypothetical protein
MATIAGTGKMLETVPTCPTATGAYTLAATIPTIGTAALTCSLATSHQHAPTTVAGW